MHEDRTAGSSGDDIGLDDLRRRVLLGFAAVCLIVPFGLVLLFSHPGGTETWTALATLALYSLAGLTLMAGRRSTAAGGAVLVAGLIALTNGALWVAPLAWAIHLLPLVVLFSSTFHGFRGGLVVAAVVTVNLALVRSPELYGNDGAMSDESYAVTLALAWANVFLAWLAAEPIRLALRWSWHEYQRAEREADRARRRQGELGQLVKSLNVAQDRLEQLNLELERARRAAQEARRLKAQFAATVSHELRTPLNLIIGFCEMMVLSPSRAYGQRLPNGFRDDLEAIYRNACHIAALVDDILDLSQIDADRMALHREWTTLAEIVAEAVGPVATLIRDRGLDLTVALAEELPLVYVDRTRVRQILINLLSNAARLTEVGGITLRAWREGSFVTVAVADSGPGIAPDDLLHLFEEFRQAGQQAGRRGGSGLGLAVSRRFAELHGGTMWADSTPGKGSTFYLRLPVGESVGGDEATGQTWGDRIAAQVRGQPERRVLVVDESGEVARVLQRYLDGYRVLGAANPQPPAQGDMQHAEGSPGRPPGAPPEEGAVEPVHAVVVGSPSAREDWRRFLPPLPEWQRLPVISCSLRTARRTAEELGVRDYLVKPVSRDQLRAALRGLGRGMRFVLVVDDDPEILGLLSRMVRSISRHYRVASAQDGTRALELMRERRPDVVLLDLLMPGLDGYGVLAAMRADPALRDVPVLVISAWGVHSEAVVADELSVRVEGGMTVAEVVRWLKGGLDAYLGLGSGAGTALIPRPLPPILGEGERRRDAAGPPPSIGPGSGTAGRG